MAAIPHLILTHGAEKARELVPTDQKRFVDIAARMLAEEEQSIGITYSGFALTALPHKAVPAGMKWERPGNRVTLIVEPGHRLVNGKSEPTAVPYGARARMVLLYLQKEAIKRGKREVVLGRSMNEWLSKMGVPVGGESFKAVKHQAQSIAHCRLSFHWDGDVKGHIQFNVVDGAFDLGTFDAARLRDMRQGNLWEEVVHLSEGFYKALTEHPVPVRELALRQLSSQSMSIDVYVWLCYRLHHLKKPTPITWEALFAQFGAGFKERKHFKPAFRLAIGHALAAYPEAQVTEEQTGLTLYPSPPAVAKLVG